MNIYKVDYEKTNNVTIVTICEFISNDIEELKKRYPARRVVSDLIKYGFVKYNENILIDINSIYNSPFKSNILILNDIRNYIIQQNRNNKLESILNEHI